MKGFLFYLFIILRISVPFGFTTDNSFENIIAHQKQQSVIDTISPMKALDLVKAKYAANFQKVDTGTGDQYYYKLPIADYYLEYEGEDIERDGYLIHLYEYVTDDPESGMGHTVTYGWYTVDKKSGAVIENME